METIGCGSGHYYNPELYSSCPECARRICTNHASLFCRSVMLRGFCQPEILASGTTGSVYRTEKGKTVYALKVIDCGNDHNRLRLAENEICMMKQLTGLSQVVQLIDSEIIRSFDGTAVLLLEEYVTSFEHYYKTHPMSIPDILRLGTHICDALERCWDAGVAYLDVQPKNLFLRGNGQFILGDFSSSLSTAQLSHEKQLRGTLSYMAPEVYERRSYSRASDIYALGMVLYCLLNRGNLPFMEGNSKETAVMTRLTQKLPVPPLHLGYELDQLLERALAADPLQRYPSFREMSLALKEVDPLKLAEKPKIPQTPGSSAEAVIGALFDSDSCAQTVPMTESVGSTVFDSVSYASTLPPEDVDIGYSTFDVIENAASPERRAGYGGRCSAAPYSSREPYDSASLRPAPRTPMSASVQVFEPAYTPAPRVSQVQFSAVAPKEARKEDYSIIQLFMYEQEFRAAVDEAIAMADSPVQEKRSGFQKVQEDTRVRVVLSCPDMVIEDNVQEQIWSCGYLQFDFAICPPKDFGKRQLLLTAAVYFNDVPATRLMLTIKALDTYEEEIELARQDIITAFVSYASQDRARVGALVQGMRKARPDMDIFFDVATLRSGENWEHTLYREILRRDILFLCWSQNAKSSEWVEREWRYALEQKGADCIEPIPLETPDVCPPPKELWNKHFNDSLLYIINR